MSNTCDVYLLNKNSDDKKFPIIDYSNVYYNKNEHTSLQDTIDKFMTYCTGTLGTDTFTSISSIDMTKRYFNVNMSYKAANEFNYCLIHDNNEDKWYCCFINSVTWNSNLTVATFNFEVDVFHTYIKTVTFKKCFVEREHVRDDTYGTHVLDEGIGVTNYNTFATVSNEGKFGAASYVPVVAVSDTSLLGHYVNGTFTKDVDEVVNVNQYEKTICLVAPNNDSSLGLKGMESFTRFIEMMYFSNKGQSIVAMYYMPSQFLSSHFIERGFQTFPEQGDTSPLGALYVTQNVTAAISSTIVTQQRPALSGDNIDIIPSYNDINIYNNKSLQYPFCFCEFSNNNSGKLQLKFEMSNASGHNCSIRFFHSPCHAGKPYLYAVNYEGLASNYNYSLTGLENPDLPYIHNSYGAYISSQRNALTNSIDFIKKDKDVALINNEVDTVQSQIGSFFNMAGAAPSDSLNVFGSAVGAMQSEVDYQQTKNNIEYSSIKSMAAVNAKLRDAKTMGNTATGVACSNSLLNLSAHGFKRYVCIAAKEELKTIDDYFSKFGYKINDYKLPELTSRSVFNYVKCSEVNLVASMPGEYINVMKAIFSQGVTLWHNLSDMYDYDFASNVASIR